MFSFHELRPILKLSLFIFFISLLFFRIEQIEDSFKVDKLNLTHHPTCICYEIYRHNWSFLLVGIHDFGENLYTNCPLTHNRNLDLIGQSGWITLTSA